MKREPKRWIVYAAMPLEMLNPSGGEMRLNVIRERHVKGKAVEYSTTSPVAMYGLWQDPKHFATLRFGE